MRGLRGSRGLAGRGSLERRSRSGSQWSREEGPGKADEPVRSPPAPEKGKTVFMKIFSPPRMALELSRLGVEMGGGHPSWDLRTGWGAPKTSEVDRLRGQIEKVRYV
eukprot:7617458-Pyramimonas_sp.AAC.2